MQEWSMKIDKLIEDEKDIKSQLPDHAQYTPIRMQLDAIIRDLRERKKEALMLWRQVNRNPEITP